MRLSDVERSNSSNCFVRPPFQGCPVPTPLSIIVTIIIISTIGISDTISNLSRTHQCEYQRPITVLVNSNTGIGAGVEEVSCHLCHYPSYPFHKELMIFLIILPRKKNPSWSSGQAEILTLRTSPKQQNCKIFIQCFPQIPGRASQMHFWQSVAARMSLMQVWISSIEFRWLQSVIASEK